jgi:acylphosphatase
MADKIFCGSGRIITTKYGELTKMSFNEKDIETLTKNLKNGWVNVVVKEKQNKVEGKPTHYVEVDTYEKKEEAPKVEVVKDDNDELPF